MRIRPPVPRSFAGFYPGHIARGLWVEVADEVRRNEITCTIGEHYDAPGRDQIALGQICDDWEPAIIESKRQLSRKPKAAVGAAAELHPGIVLDVGFGQKEGRTPRTRLAREGQVVEVVPADGGRTDRLVESLMAQIHPALIEAPTTVIRGEVELRALAHQRDRVQLRLIGEAVMEGDAIIVRAEDCLNMPAIDAFGQREDDFVEMIASARGLGGDELVDFVDRAALGASDVERTEILGVENVEAQRRWRDDRLALALYLIARRGVTDGCLDRHLHAAIG